MFHAKVFAVLLVVGLSSQNAIRSKLFDDIMPDVSKKCQDAMTEKTAEVQACANTLGQKYQSKIAGDVGNTEALKKDVCDLIKEEENQCVNLVKGPCTDDEIAKIDRAIEQVVEQQLKQALGVDIDCSKQTATKITFFDSIIPDVSKKCQDAMTEKSAEAETCANTVAQKYQSKIAGDMGNIEALKKDVCALIKDEENQCVNMLKGSCTDDEIVKIDNFLEQVVEQQLKQALGVDIDCSEQTETKSTLFGDTMPDVSKKCQDAMTEKTAEVQTCANNLGQKYQSKIAADVGNTEALKKDVCDLLKEEENECVTLVKGPCTDDEIAKIDRMIEQVVEQQLKQSLGVDINCSN